MRQCAALSAVGIPVLQGGEDVKSINSFSAGLVTRFGGHAQAAGLTLEPEDPAFDGVLRAGAAQSTTDGTFCDMILTDDPLAIHERATEAACAIETGGPWGQGFPAPRFVGDFQVAAIRPLSGGLRAKLTVAGKGDAPLKAVVFQRAARLHTGSPRSGRRVAHL